MSWLRRALLVLLLATASAGTARAQSAGEQVAQGIRAVQNLEYDSAAALLRGALGRTGPGSLGDSARVRALMYLGATEFFRDKRDSASAAFRRLLVLAPRFRPDQLVFPPEVSSLFEEVRIGTPAVAVSVAPVTDLQTAGDRLVARLYAASLHMITATVQRPDGRVLRQLYSGAIGDSLEVLWDGRDSTGAAPDSGSFVLRVVSRGQGVRVVRSVEVPLDLRASTARDTVPLPPPLPDSALLPETGTPPGGGTRPLLIGLGGAAAAAVLPSFAGSESASGARYAVSAASVIAGVVGFMAARRPQPLPANIAANQQQRLAWQQRVDAVRAENATRRQNRRVIIRAGAPRQIEGQ